MLLRARIDEDQRPTRCRILVPDNNRRMKTVACTALAIPRDIYLLTWRETSDYYLFLQVNEVEWYMGVIPNELTLTQQENEIYDTVLQMELRSTEVELNPASMYAKYMQKCIDGKGVSSSSNRTLNDYIKITFNKPTGKCIINRKKSEDKVKLYIPLHEKVIKTGEIRTNRLCSLFGIEYIPNNHHHQSSSGDVYEINLENGRRWESELNVYIHGDYRIILVKSDICKGCIFAGEFVKNLLCVLCTNNLSTGMQCINNPVYVPVSSFIKSKNTNEEIDISVYVTDLNDNYINFAHSTKLLIMSLDFA